MVIKLSQEQVNSWRLSKNHLDKRTPKAEIARVVSDLCGVQAQVLFGAALSIWARVDNITIHDVEDALWRQRTLVKTWAMRGTLHLLSSRDLPTYVAALKTRQDPEREQIPYRIGPGPEDRQYHITRAEQEQVARAIRDSLDQHILTREELANEIIKRTKLRPILQSHLLSGFGSLLQQAAYQGSLIFGPSQGTRVTFTRPDQWLEKWDEDPAKESLKTLLHRFHTTYGPATPQDFAHWWGIKPTEARSLLDLISDELVEVEFNGHRAMMRKNDLDQIQSIGEAHSLRLVPSWDTYVMFYHPREQFVPSAYRTKIFRKLEGNAPVLLVDGLAAGTWEKQKVRNHAKIIVRPFQPLTTSQRRVVIDEVSSLAEFLGSGVQVSFSS